MSAAQRPEDGHWVDVVVPSPSHSGMGPLLTYRAPAPVKPGTLVRVPLGQRELLGLVWEAPGLSLEGLVCEEPTRPDQISLSINNKKPSRDLGRGESQGSGMDLFCVYP